MNRLFFMFVFVVVVVGCGCCFLFYFLSSYVLFCSVRLSVLFSLVFLFFVSFFLFSLMRCVEFVCFLLGDFLELFGVVLSSAGWRNMCISAAKTTQTKTEVRRVVPRCWGLAAVAVGTDPPVCDLPASRLDREGL